MDGLLVIDKPAGPTSHDVVARLRRALGERRIGHTGTLDPGATGVLPLLLGRATRLAQFISRADKGYRAVLHLGVRTDSGDADGRPLGEPWHGALPDAAAIEAALDRFRGRFLQRPPSFSAKKVAGRRSYAVARERRRSETEINAAAPKTALDIEAAGDQPGAIAVTAHRLSLEAIDGECLTLDIKCSAGFYVRSLADDLGQQLGTGAHLVALQRTRHGDFTLADAISLDRAEQDAAGAHRRIIPMSRLLTTLDAVTLTPEGVKSAAHGRDLTPAAFAHLPGAMRDHPDLSTDRLVRLLSPAGDLVGIARPSTTAGLLHPFVVLM
jgi:tRNA pseudouridine55 synthase